VAGWSSTHRNGGEEKTANSPSVGTAYMKLKFLPEVFSFQGLMTGMACNESGRDDKEINLKLDVASFGLI
jgi:hypothetical protein